MNTTEEKTKKTITVDLPSEVKNKFDEVKKSGNWTQESLFCEMFANFLEPRQKFEDQQEQINFLTGNIEQATAQIENLQEEIKTVKEELRQTAEERDNLILNIETERTDRDNERVNSDNDRHILEEENIKLNERLNESFNLLQATEQELNSLKNSISNSPQIIIDPLNLKLLEYVADREGKRRNQAWTISDVINFFVYCRFEKGNLNGDLNSVPDSIVKKFKNELQQLDGTSKNQIDI